MNHVCLHFSAKLSGSEVCHHIVITSSFSSPLILRGKNYVNWATIFMWDSRTMPELGFSACSVMPLRHSLFRLRVPAFRLCDRVSMTFKGGGAPPCRFHPNVHMYAVIFHSNTSIGRKANSFYLF